MLRRQAETALVGFRAHRTLPRPTPLGPRRSRGSTEVAGAGRTGCGASPARAARDARAVRRGLGAPRRASCGAVERGATKAPTAVRLRDRTSRRSRAIHGALSRPARRGCRVCTRSSGIPGALDASRRASARSLCELGRLDEAERWAVRAAELGDERDYVTQMLWRQVEALVLARRGEHRRGRATGAGSGRDRRATEALNAQARRVLRPRPGPDAAGRTDEAAEALEQALDRYERKKNLAMVASARSRSLEELRARVS